MKKSMLLLAFLGLLFAQKSNAQWIYTTTTATGGNGILQTNGAYNIYFGNNSTQMTLNSSGQLGIGPSFAPNYLLDVNGDIDVNSTSNGYRLGGTTAGWGYFLWNNGEIGSIYAGIGAGNGTNTGSMNTLLGAYAGHNITVNSYNSIVGYEAGISITGGTSPQGDYNTIMGYKCGEYMQTGVANNYYGKAAGDYCNGNENAIFGSHAGFGGVLYSADSNAFFGNYSAYELYTGSNNVFVGANAGYASGNQPGGVTTLDNVFIGANSGKVNIGGAYNITLGFGADAYTGTPGSPASITNAAAIGAHAVVNRSNSIILGNNDQWTGIGLSYNGSYGYPNNSLEICSRTQTGTIISNSSGLRFTNLTASSPVITNPGAGVLALNTNGDVVYVAASSGIGTCSGPTTLTPANGAVDMANVANMYFLGNGNGTTVNNVAIGLTCSSVPTAKLDVLQSSGTTNNQSIGLLVENTDAPQCGAVITKPMVTGIASILPNTSNSTSKVAGWFEADRSSSCCSSSPSAPQYAIYVPINGGSVALGYNWNSASTSSPNQTCPSGFELDVNGSAFLSSGTLWTTSDSNIKTNLNPINNPIGTIKKLNGLSFNYVSSAISDSGSTGTHYGFIAQQVARVIPNVVKTNKSTGLKGVAYTEIIPWLVEGMKQQQQMIDSLKTALANVQSAMRGGNGGTSDSTTITNVQNITLSSSTGAPLLYQNTPNPFSTGTKINYYLPEGTMGASIMFFDTYGNQIKTVQLNQTGNGTLNVASDNLTNGIYSYSLIINGAVIDTKRMVLQK